MKLVSWNVNGLRAVLKKDFIDIFNSIDADIFCIQETKMQDGQAQVDTPDHYQYIYSAHKKGYSGTMVFTKKEPMAVHYGLGVEHLDNEGRLLTLEYEEFYLLNSYSPNSQDALKRLDYRLEYDGALHDYMESLAKIKPVILCGDLNVAHQEIDLKNPARNHFNPGFSDQERDSFSQLLSRGFIDTFRHLYPDVTDIYSWWSYRFKARDKNIGWRIDYFVVSQALKDQIKEAQILNDVYGSDHCPVVLELECHKW
ncbi:MAG: exodeoxyribonuclease III [Erysipelotrichaceae bacterium]|nr:exodeoxyribonuclease III [Erysipelotrichaceae bacterium]